MPFKADGTFVPEDVPTNGQTDPTPDIPGDPTHTLSGAGNTALADGAGADVNRQLSRVLSSEGPLLTQARTRAKQASNRRGLLNSSIAVQAGEEAALGVALKRRTEITPDIHTQIKITTIALIDYS